MYNQKKDNNKFKNKKQPELPANQTVWKSNNQGVKEETFIQTSRKGRGGSRQGAGWRTGHSHIHVQINWRNNWGARQTAQPRVPVQENKAAKSLTENTCEGYGGWRNSQPHRRVHCRDPQGPGTYTNPPTRESAPEVPNLIVSSGGSD